MSVYSWSVAGLMILGLLAVWAIYKFRVKKGAWWERESAKFELELILGWVLVLMAGAASFLYPHFRTEPRVQFPKQFPPTVEEKQRSEEMARDDRRRDFERRKRNLAVQHILDQEMADIEWQALLFGQPGGFNQLSKFQLGVLLLLESYEPETFKNLVKRWKLDPATLEPLKKEP